ncbi:MAG: DUF3300 domain-containing protein [Acetobacteraceae bacterium]
MNGSMRAAAVLAALATAGTLPVLSPCAVAQVSPAAQQSEATEFNPEQLDALLAPIALYPDSLLTQVLMAATYPLQIVGASRWLEQGSNAQLHGDALAKALEGQNWDPSVKSLVPFPQVLAMMNGTLDWTQQVGYAFATQQADVMNSIQRLRAQAEQAGSLHSTPQQTVSSEQGAIVIQPADPQTVYLPVYNPTVVYGTWPYPAVPPVYFPPPGYLAANAFVSGLAFATGVAVVGSLWGWSRPAWGHGSVNVNVNRWNNISVNRTPIRSDVWRPPAPGAAGGRIRPPGGPVGAPARLNGLPANAIGRQSVHVQSALVRGPAPGGGLGQAVSRPGPAGGQGNLASRTLARPAAGGNAVQRPAAPRAPAPAAARPATRAQGGAFAGLSEGSRATQYGARGAQSRSFQQAGQGGGIRPAAPRGGGRR